MAETTDAEGEAEALAVARRNGLGELHPGEARRLVRMLDRVSAASATIPRMLAKADEPAHVMQIKPA